MQEYALLTINREILACGVASRSQLQATESASDEHQVNDQAETLATGTRRRSRYRPKSHHSNEIVQRPLLQTVYDRQTGKCRSRAPDAFIGFNYKAVEGGNIWAFHHLLDRQRPDLVGESGRFSLNDGGFFGHVFALGPLGRNSAVTGAFL